MAKDTRIQMFPHEWRASTTLSGVYALRMLGMFLVLPVLSLYAASLPGAENNKTLVGLAMGIYGLTQALLQLPLGIASDKFGRKKTIYVGLIVFAAGSFLAAAANSLPMLVAARAIQGAGAVSAAGTALLADLTRDGVRTRAMAMIGLSIGLTFSVSLVVAPMIADIIGVPGLFMLTGILTVISIGVVAWMTPDPEVSKLHEDTQAQPSRMGEVLRDRQLLNLDFGIFALHAAQMALFTALPFAMILFALWFNKGKQQAPGRHRRDRRRPTMWTSYLSGQFFLPLLAIFYLIGYPLVNEYILSSGVSAERSEAAQYIKEKTKDGDTIYAWDTSASLYQKSSRLSAVSLLTPTLYVGTAENRLGLQKGLENSQPKYILVNNDVKLLSDVKQLISQNYKEADLKLDHFKLYQLK